MPSIPDLPPNTSLAGRSVLITGSNSGLGYHAALLSLQLGASPVYLAVRTCEKGNAARSSLLADPIVQKRNPHAIVKVYELDMSRWESVTGFAKTFISDRRAAGEGLDIAMLNAGLAYLNWQLAPTGNEITIQVNHLSTALLCLLLLPLLQASTTSGHTARLMVVSSGQHREAGVSRCPPDNINYLESLNKKEQFSTMHTYGLSKLLLIFFLRELADRVSSKDVIINNVCPGIIKTGLSRQAPWWTAPILWTLGLREANPVEKGAACYIHAVACVGPESHGKWYRRMALTPYGPFVTSPDGQKMQKKVWKETMQVLEGVAPGVAHNI